MPYGKKITCRQLCKYLDGRLLNNHFFYGLLQQVWILATRCIPSRTVSWRNLTFFTTMVWYKSINVCNMMYSLWGNKNIFFKKKIYQLSKNLFKYRAVMYTWAACPFYQVLEQFCKNIQNFSSFCVFQGIFRSAFRTNIYDVW